MKRFKTAGTAWLEPEIVGRPFALQLPRYSGPAYLGSAQSFTITAALMTTERLILAFRFRPLGLGKGNKVVLDRKVMPREPAVNPAKSWAAKALAVEAKKGTSASSAASAFPVSVIKDSFGT